jgi:hypothetical protein
MAATFRRGEVAARAALVASPRLVVGKPGQSLIPNDQQIADYVALLRTRSDADSEAIQKIIAQASQPAAGEEHERR